MTDPIRGHTDYPALRNEPSAPRVVHLNRLNQSGETWFEVGDPSKALHSVAAPGPTSKDSITTMAHAALFFTSPQLCRQWQAPGLSFLPGR